MKFHVYKSEDGWRWRLKAANGEIVADSGEAYTRRTDVKRAIRMLKWNVAIAGVIDDSSET